MRNRLASQRLASASAMEMFSLAPAVMAMRMPILAAEMMTPHSARSESNRAVSEKTLATAQGLFAAQVAMVTAAPRFWFAVMSGGNPGRALESAAGNALAAAMRPSGKRVKSNYRRLASRSKR